MRNVLRDLVVKRKREIVLRNKLAVKILSDLILIYSEGPSESSVFMQSIFIKELAREKKSYSFTEISFLSF